MADFLAVRRRLSSTTYPFSVWLGSRIALALASWIGMSVDGGLREQFKPRHLFSSVPAFDAWCRWDCEWFLAVAQQGNYANAPQTNFFPLLPFLARGLWFITRIPIHWSMLVVSNLACLGSCIVLFRMFRRLGSEQVARWGVAFFAAYPFAFFQANGYPESLMIFTSALALDLATRGKHFGAGAALAVGMLSRHLTLLAGAGLLVAQVQQRPSLGRFFKSPSWLALGLPWLSLVLYCLYQKIVWGDAFAFYEARKLWGPMAYWGLTDHLKAKGPMDMYRTLITSYLPFALVVTVGVVVACFRKEALAPAAFGVVLCITIWSIGLWAIGRYSASCWPAFFGLGLLAGKNPTLGPILVSVFALFQGIFFYLFMHQFPVL